MSSDPLTLPKEARRHHPYRSLCAGVLLQGLRDALNGDPLSQAEWDGVKRWTQHISLPDSLVDAFDEITSPESSDDQSETTVGAHVSDGPETRVLPQLGDGVNVGEPVPSGR